jgi:glycine/D-amino acid oxidase-like deaminating enzyme
MQRVLIIGGGAIGSAIAYFLTRRPGSFAVTVIERDPAYRQASSALSASSIRQQFSTAINIRMSQYGIAFLRDIGATLRAGGAAPDVGLTEPGYLFLASAEGAAVLNENHIVQRAHGVDAALLAPDALQARFPWIAAEGVALASLGLSGEGWFDGYSLLQALRGKALAQGARYVQAQAGGFARAGDRIAAVHLADGESLPCDAVVNAAGPWAAAVAAWADIALPVRAAGDGVQFSCPQTLPSCPLVMTRQEFVPPEGRHYRRHGAPAEKTWMTCRWWRSTMRSRRTGPAARVLASRRCA